MDKIYLEKVNVRLRQRKVAKIQQSFLTAYGGFVVLTIGLFLTTWVADFWADLFLLVSRINRANALLNLEPSLSSHFRPGRSRGSILPPDVSCWFAL